MIESLRVIVDQIWDTFDLDGSKTLDKEEVRAFVLEYLPDLKKNFVYNEEQFEKLWHELDVDGNGVVEKHEMALFLKRMIYDQ